MTERTNTTLLGAAAIASAMGMFLASYFAGMGLFLENNFVMIGSAVLAGLFGLLTAILVRKMEARGKRRGRGPKNGADRG